MTCEYLHCPLALDQFSLLSMRWINVENLLKNHMSFHSGSLGQEYNDPNDYFNAANHEVDQQEELEYEVGNQEIVIAFYIQP